ncbi:MAG: TolC family protein [Bacteroidales bacterium]|nr:TolC family protein [Bacteroidales bacterium]
MESISRFIILSCSFLFLTGMTFCLKAQGNTSESNSQAIDIAKLSPEYYSRLTLPPLSVFLDAAKKGSKIGFLKATKKEEEAGLKTSRREWINSFRLFGNYQYGALGANVTNATEAGGQTILYSGQIQSIYNGGMALSLPLDVLIDRKNRIAKQQSRVEQMDYQIAEAMELLKIDIADTYITALQCLNTLKIQAESIIYSNSDIKMSETSYLNGNLELADLTYRKSMQTTAVTNYEVTKGQLNKAILRLEILTNIKILK